MKRHIIVIDIVGLEEKHLVSNYLPTINNLASLGEYCKLKPVFPAVTCSVQTSFLTGEYPNRHGIVSNGFMDRNTYNVSFWEQYSSLVQAPRIWDLAKRRDPNLNTAVLFWQNTLYANSDVIITPKPIHLENEMIMWCYSKPVGYYEEIGEKIGNFDLSKYWGPFASHLSSEWICNATQYTIEKYKPNLMFTYIPHVDYSAQRFGKDSSEVHNDLVKTDILVERIIESTKTVGIYDNTQFIIFSEYSFNNVTDAIPINLVLRDNSMLNVREINGKEYVDFEFSKAFAVVDHQIANIYIKSSQEFSNVLKILQNIPDIEIIITNEEKKFFNINHERTGDIIAVSKRNKWFSYYWWYDKEHAPDFANRVDIHRKPGYDPLELFINPQTKSIPFETNLIKGSHGRPFNPQTLEGCSLYVSNVKSGIQRDSENAVNVVDIGKYLIGSN